MHDTHGKNSFFKSGRRQAQAETRQSAGNVNRRYATSTFRSLFQLLWPHLLRLKPSLRSSSLESLKHGGLKKKWLFTDHEAKRPLNEPTLQKLHRRPTYHYIHGETVFLNQQETWENKLGDRMKQLV